MALESSSDEETSERKQEDKLILASNQVFRVMPRQMSNKQQPFDLAPMHFKTDVQTRSSPKRITGTKGSINFFL